MADPAKITRTPPTGDVMRDGYQTLIAFSLKPAVKVWEKGVTPMGFDGGDNIDATTMHNSTWRTFGVPQLVTLTAGSIRVAYLPEAFDELIDMINEEQEITVKFPKGGFVSFWGRIRSFEPDELVEGSQPEATINIEPTNWDPSNNVEAGYKWYGT